MPNVSQAPLSTGQPSNSVEPLRLIRCKVGENQVCLPMDYVASVEHTCQFQPLEDGPQDPLIGSLEAEGVEIPVVSLASQLGLASPECLENQKIVVLEGEHDRWGLLVDDVSSIETAGAAQLRPLPALIASLPANPFSGVVLGNSPGKPSFRWPKPDAALLLSPERLLARALGEPLPEKDGLLEGYPNLVSPVEGFDGQRIGGREDSAPRCRIVRFTVEGDTCPTATFALSVSQVLEIIEPRSPIQVPFAPKFLQGLVNWRNRVAVVVDFAELFGFPDHTRATHRTRLLIVGAGLRSAELLAVPVDPFARVGGPPRVCRPCDVPPHVDAQFVLASFNVAGQVLIVPDVARILSAEKSQSCPSNVGRTPGKAVTAAH